jgi:hypothetical protein
MADLLSLERIRTEGTQVRVALSETVIREYADALARGDEFPPIEVYYDETAYWLADGFHRVQAAQQAGRDSLAATIHPGGQREALLHALSANDTHGYRRTDADRRHAIELLLADPKWREWNNSAIARQCRVSEFLVRTVRQELAPPQETQEPPERTRKVTRGGKTYTMSTGRIGTAARAKAPAAPSSARSPAPTAPVVPFESGGSDTEDISASVSSMASKIGTLAAGVPPPHQEGQPPLPVAAAMTADGAPPAPTTPPPQPSLMDAWQQASDDERKAFVARYRDDLRRLLTALAEQQPKKRTSASQRPSRPQPQQQKRRRAAAGKRS